MNMITDQYIEEKSKDQILRDQIDGKKMRFRICKEEKYGWRSWFEPFGYNGRITIRNEFYLFKKDFDIALSFRHDSEGCVAFHIAIPFLFSWYFGLDALFGYTDWWKNLWRIRSKFGSRKFEFGWLPAYGSVDGGSFKCSFGGKLYEWSSRDPWWYSFSFTPKTFFCGKTKYEETDKATVDRRVLVKGDHKYPDQEYDLICKVFESKWSWKRFLKPLIITRTNVEVANGGQVPHPGKGTADYNCGEDGLRSQTSAESDPDKAIEKFVDQVYWYRKNYPL